MTTKENATAATVAQHMANLRGLYGQAKVNPYSGKRKGCWESPKSADEPACRLEGKAGPVAPAWLGGDE